MIVKIAKRERDFTVIGNDVLCDTRLSIAARGLLAYLLHLPPHWEVKMSKVAEMACLSSKGARKLMKELRLVGYAKLVATQRADHSFAGKTYIIYDVAKQNQEPSVLGRSLNGGVNTLLRKVLERTDSRDQTKTAQKGSFGLEGERNGRIMELVNTFVEFTIQHRLYVGKNGSTITGWNKRTIARWHKAMADLIEQVSSRKQVKRVLHWYVEHWQDDYVPTVYSIDSFVKKYANLLRAMQRAERPSKEGHDEYELRQVYKDEADSPTGEAGWFSEYKRRK